MTTELDHVAIIGDQRMPTSALVVARWKRWVAPAIARDCPKQEPAQFVKVQAVDVEAVTNAERRAQELEIMRSRGEI